MTLQPKPTDSELPARVRALEEQLAKLLTRPGPPLLLPWVCFVDKPGYYAYVSVGGETDVYVSRLSVVTHDAVKVSAPIGADVGTTAEYWLKAIGPGGVLIAETDRISHVGDAGVHRLEWTWTPQWEDEIGGYDEVSLYLLGERTAGVGAYFIGEPRGCVAPSTEIDATLSGSPAIDP